MSSWLTGILSGSSTAVAEKVAAFAEARHAVLADNIANIDTPYYKVRDLPVAEFQSMLAEAIRKSRAGGTPLEFQSTRHIAVRADGSLDLEPVERRDADLLFHDQGNRSIEQEMGEMAKNALLHRVAAEVLRKQFDTLESAIQGRL